MAERHRPLAFVIRVQQHGPGIRGQVVEVASGIARLFDALAEAMAFIEAQVREEGRRSADGDREAELHRDGMESG